MTNDTIPETDDEATACNDVPFKDSKGGEEDEIEEGQDFSGGSSDEYVPNTDEEADAAAEEQEDAVEDDKVMPDLDLSVVQEEALIEEEQPDDINNNDTNGPTRKRKVISIVYYYNYDFLIKQMVCPLYKFPDKNSRMDAK